MQSDWIVKKKIVSLIIEPSSFLPVSLEMAKLSAVGKIILVVPFSILGEAMTTFSRRAFSRLITTVSTSLLLVDRANGAWLPITEGDASIPPNIAGYDLTQEERVLAAKFVIEQNKSLSKPRGNDLPNGLAPSFTPMSFLSRDPNGKSR